MKQNVEVIIPFRDRGLDPRRGANLDVVMAWWWAHGVTPKVVSDGLDGDAPFNRHRAYNIAVSENPKADVFVFTEADMLLSPRNILEATRLAGEQPGLVVPFDQYRYLNDASTAWVRHVFSEFPVRDLAEFVQSGEVFALKPESVMNNGKSIGAVNVVSRETLDRTGGFTEATSGNWYDDNIIEEGFAYLTRQKTRHIKGPAVHLYHLPGWKGDLSQEDKDATARNKRLLGTLRAVVQQNSSESREWVRDLLAYRQEDGE